MDQLLAYLIKHLSFLYQDHGYKLVDSEVLGADAVLVLASEEMRIRLIRDRGQLFLDFQAADGLDEWYSVDILWHHLRGEPRRSSELDDAYVEFVATRLEDIEGLFTSGDLVAVHNRLHDLELERSQHLWQRFRDLAESEFAFLSERGFRSVVETEHAIRYENNDGVFVRVVRDPNDKYVGFRVGLKGHPRDAITATELARLTGSSESGGAYANSPSELAEAVAEVARQLRKHGGRALAGDESIYDDAMELRRRYTDQFTRRD